MANERLEEVRNVRLQKREQLIKDGLPPYPSEVRRTHTVAELLDAFGTLTESGEAVAVLGRIMGLRRHGGLAFLDLHDASGGIQLQVTKDTLPPEQFSRLDMVDVGDWLQATGTVTKTQRGVETIILSSFIVVSKSIRPLPDSWYGLKDHEARFRQREIDLLLNEKVRSLFALRSAVTAWLRTYLLDKGFLEVETPVLQPIAGGAAAKPFTTHHNALDMELYLRIAPELYLKRLLVGGYEKVFEIGRNFRNEGISRQHNPEFTMLEFYWAFADYEDLMEMAEQMLASLVEELTGSTEVTWQDETFSFEKPLPRKRFIDLMNEFTGFDILEEKSPAKYVDLFKKHSLEVPAVQTYAKLVDELYKEMVRPTLVQPTIIYDYPAEMIPLAKQNLTDPRIAEMFQLVVAGTEIIKAYTELNDPVIQRALFEGQQQARQQGDEEAQAIDEPYIRALEYGMPPAGGLGLGIDRLLMLLSNSPTLRDVILFPLLRNED